MNWTFGEAFLNTYLSAKKESQEQEQFQQKLGFEQRQLDLANKFKEKSFELQERETNLGERKFVADEKYKEGVLKNTARNIELDYIAQIAKTQADAEAKLRDDLRSESQFKQTLNLNKAKLGLDQQKYELEKLEKMGKLANVKQNTIGKDISEEVGNLGKYLTAYRQFKSDEDKIKVPTATGEEQELDKTAWRATVNKELYSLLTKTGIDPEGQEITDLWQLAKGNMTDEMFNKKSPEEKKTALKFALEQYTKQVNLNLPQKTALQFYIEGMTK